MKYFDAKQMQMLTFPDFEIIEMKMDSESKKLRIKVEGAWEKISAQSLGIGILFFDNWQKISVKEFSNPSDLDKDWTWKSINNLEPLKDICEIEFQSNSATLRGFGKITGNWIELIIQGSDMHAEFI